MAVDKIINETQGDDIIDRLEEIADKIHDINYGLETSSNKVVSMSGYQKSTAATPGAISPGDTLNEAVGKLEKKVDNNTANKVAGPESATVGNIATFANADGKSVQDSEVAIVTTMDNTSDAEVPTSEAIGEYITDQKFAVGLDSSTANHLVKFKDNNGKNLEDTGISVETSSASALSNDDVHIPTSKLVKTEVDKKVTSIKAPVSGSSTKVDKNNEVSFQQASGQSPAVTVTGDATNGTVTIEHQTGSGFNHLPKSGAAGKYLKWKTNDDGEWVAPDSTWPANPDNTTIPGTKLVDDRFDTDETNINAVEDMICDDEFNTTTDYNIGDIVTHDHGLYQFKSAHTKGTWNSSHVNQITITDQILDLNRLVRNTQPVYGYRIDKNNLDPDTRVEYLFDAVGMTPAYMNFSTGQFNYGSWGDIWFIKNNKPVALNFDGTEAFELNPTNYWQKSDGTTAIDIEDATLNYNYMSRIPTVYVKRWEDNQYNYVAFTQYPQGGFTAYAHQGASGRINENMYLPMFKGFKDSNGKLRSLAGKTPWNTTGGIGYELDAAKAIATTNNGWQIWDFAKHELISDLLTLISKHTSSRWKFGKGVIKTASSAAGFCKGGYDYDGTTKAACAQFWGTDEGTGNTPSTEDGSHHVRVFHIEDLWGNRWERCLGLHLINGIYKVKMFAPYYATAPTGSGALLPDETYETLSLTPPSGNYLQNQSTGFYGNIPISTSGDKNKGYCSYFWQSSGADRLLFFGGHCGAGFACSARCLHLDDASVTSFWGLGASPCFNHL